MTASSEGYTAQSCLSCRTTKRKCDKQLPSCSRCKRASRQCLYGSGAYAAYGRIVAITDQEMIEIGSEPSWSMCTTHSPKDTVGNSCRRCRKQKKFCDKAYPCCARCKRQGATCTYEQLDRLRLLSSQHFFASGVSGQSVVQLKPSYPVKARPYIPRLIQYFQERMGLSALQVDIDSLAYHLRSSWLHNALTDPCLFHATLYAASAQLDTIRETTTTAPANPTDINRVTLYHHTKTIEAVNARIIASTGSGQLDDVTIAAVLMLVITGSLQSDNRAAELHRRGLLRMVAMRGGLEKLGFDGFLAQMITMNMILPAVVFDRIDVPPVEGFNCPPTWNNLPNLILNRLRTNSSTGNAVVRMSMTAMFEHVRELLLAVDAGQDETGNPRFDFIAARRVLDTGGWPKDHYIDSESESERNRASSSESTSPNPPWPESISSTERVMLQACRASVRMLRYLLDDRLSPQLQTPRLLALVEDMKSHVALGDPSTWLRYTPQANLWVIMLGMAVSEDIRGRLWFLMEEKCVSMSIKVTGKPAIYDEFWTCYCGIRKLIHARWRLWTDGMGDVVDEED